MIDIHAKELMREYLKAKVEEDRQRMGMYKGAGGFTVRESELERFLDGMWLHVNKGLLEQNESKK